MTTRRWLVFAAIFFFGSAVHAATVKQLSTHELAKNSSVIFIGVVTSQTVSHQRQPTKIWTTTTFEVERTLKGTHQAHITLQQLGGQVGEGHDRLVQKVHGYPGFKTSERVLLFLETADAGHLVVTGMAQGKFTLTAETEDRQVMASRDLSEIRYPAPNPHVRHLAGMPSPSSTIYLDQLIDIIEGRRPIARPIPLRLVKPKQPAGLPNVTEASP